ncbi:hypothetical protein AXF42_Ash020807 [Apostasia shenzhenica]|uniref:Uncharacterized protein n=1 Tax=Apostasia shenzhenica TaxID=1088818 RepID=A0A2I0AZN8_9ASPA|nr:hypothetical protein AXF42_Ash020807 [Apostasia shenzhenica]
MSNLLDFSVYQICIYAFATRFQHVRVAFSENLRRGFRRVFDAFSKHFRRGFNAVSTRLGPGFEAARRFHAFSTWVSRGFHAVSTRFRRGYHAFSTRFPRGYHAFLTRVFAAVSPRFPRVFDATSTRFRRGFHVFSTRFSRFFHVFSTRLSRVFDVVFTRFRRGFHAVPTRFRCGYHAFSTRFPRGNLQSPRYQKVCAIESPSFLPDIVFSAGDLPQEGVNHDDPIVIVAEIGGCDIHRILVDTGSSVNMLYLRAFNKMGVGQCKPLPPSMTISSFSGDIYRPVGYATLGVALEEGPKKLVKEIDFIIMDGPFSSNAILGRPTMAVFQMAVMRGG